MDSTEEIDETRDASNAGQIAMEDMEERNPEENAMMPVMPV